MTTLLDTRQTAVSSLKGVIRRHPLVAFFALATGTSWVAWIPYIFSSHGLGLWDLRFPDILGSAQLAGVLPGAYLGPISAAFVVTAVTDGRPGLRRWVARLFRWRISWYWYAGVLLVVPAALIAAGAAFSGGSILAPSMLALIAYVPGLVIQMLTTGLAEEPGWRDFALPRLQRTFGPVRASLVLGPLWGIWHLPLLFSEWGGWPDADWTRPVYFMGFCIAFTIVVSWVFNRTGESLPIVILLHVGVNNTSSILLPEMFPAMSVETSFLASFVVAAIAAMILLVLTRGRLGYPKSEMILDSDHGRL
ncbi:CPBP family intramembrane glutamic endopeptidase [Salinibacterium sp.]|uniref:CPBP family intramembrane glutamic endopeptidase n=1 Tax=Salinibacterium sp. TaxID=1915057 RepID=UPI00286A947A|nr:CPBP family intramembrane glutamic endopeptidase [Salinibacterium sp.]